MPAGATVACGAGSARPGMPPAATVLGLRHFAAVHDLDPVDVLDRAAVDDAGQRAAVLDDVERNGLRNATLAAKATLAADSTAP